MAEAVSTAGGLTPPPDWALARVPGLETGEPPLRVERLGGGTVNQVFRIDSRAGRFVLRLDGPSWRRPGVDRGRELQLHRAAAAAGIAPALLRAAPDAHGLLVSEFHEGRIWRDADYGERGSLRRLGERLQRLHAITPPRVAPFDPWQVAQGYVRQIGPGHAAALAAVLARLRGATAAVRTGAASRCIVHGDLWQGNVLQARRVWLLDWEYAQLADPLMDLACVLAYYPAARRHRLDLAAAAGLSSRALARELAPRVYVYRALSWLWHLARAETGEPP